MTAAEDLWTERRRMQAVLKFEQAALFRAVIMGSPTMCRGIITCAIPNYLQNEPDGFRK
jgi:hypothetical protein